MLKKSPKGLSPNGAIGALDLMQTFALMGDVQIEIGNRKAPKSLEGAPYLKVKHYPQIVSRLSLLDQSGSY